jgi:ZIP family zinc transporter
MLEAAFWGFVAASTLLVGAALASVHQWSTRSIGLIAGFGVGALISAVTLDLTEEAFSMAGTPVVVAGLVGGAVAFTAGNFALTRNDNDRKRSGGQQADSSALGIVLGTILDGVPESIVIGTSLLTGESVGVAFLAAVAISNLPEAMSATSGLLKSGWTRGRIFRLWVYVVVISTIAAGLGNGLLGGAPQEWIALVEAFSAGAVLTMLADTMMPEAYEDAGPAVGLATVAGYAIAALLTLV